MDAQEITLLTVMNGSIPAFFEKAVRAIWADIADPNKSVKTVRKLTMEFSFTPYPDRSGMQVDLKPISPVLGPIDTSGFSCSAFLAKRDGVYLAFTRDLRQELLFDDKDIIPDGKSAAAGEK